MSKRKEYAGIDNFRIIAAFMIVAIHTAPLEKISAAADFLLTYCLGRIGVPFFLMTTGFFLLAPYAGKQPGEMAFGRLKRYLLRTLVMYIGITILYLPITIYAGNLPGGLGGNLPGGLGGWLRWLFMDGTFYHLWYLPASLIGCLITALLLRYAGPYVTSGCTFLLYMIGLFGDSFYGAVGGIGFLKIFYDAVFSISEYTRNGIFFAPVFLWMGAMIGARHHGSVKINERQAVDERQAVNERKIVDERQAVNERQSLDERQAVDERKIVDVSQAVNERQSMDIKQATNVRQSTGKRQSGSGRRLESVPEYIWMGFAVCLVLMLAEGYLSWIFGLQKHNSMYLFLLPVMFFFMEGLLLIKGRTRTFLRPVSMWIYLLHPLCIIVLRGGAKAVNLQEILVENQLIFFLLVCVLSLCTGGVLEFLRGWIRGRIRSRSQIQ